MTTNNTTNVSLILTMDRMVVCKLPATSAIPSWATNESCFFSCITRTTTQELSIVCPQQACPVETLPHVDTDWVCFQVQEPLEISRTDILARLAPPLAEADISMLAMSTDNTHYLLVQHAQVERAMDIWQTTGFCSMTVLPTRGSSNGASTTFCQDDMVRPLQQHPRHPHLWPRTFGLVLVAGWPPSTSVQEHYQDRIVPLLRQCFTDEDWNEAVYSYPSSALHVTLATLKSFVASFREQEKNQLSRDLQQQQQQQQHEMNNAQILIQDALQKWKSYLSESNLPSIIKLELHSLQLGNKAAILLWKDATGQLQRLRRILRSLVLEEPFTAQEQCTFADTLSIPDILHTTVLRFARVPREEGAEIQKHFQALLLHSKTKVSMDWPIDAVSLVCERFPYMHIPYDDRHVLLRHELSSMEGRETNK